MRIEAVKQKQIVRYPDKYEVDINQMLLNHKPARWNNSPTAKLMLGALIASQLAGCALKQNNPQGESSDTIRKMNMAPIFEGKVVVSSLTNEKTVSLVPLGNFPGPGEGSFPGIDPLTEADALKIIGDILASEGLRISSSEKKALVETEPKDSTDQKLAAWSFDLNVNGAKEPIYIEFIPVVEAETKSELSERESLDLPDGPIEAAYKLREKLSEVEDESSGAIFYSSRSTTIQKGSLIQDGIMINQEGNLREQVNEFVTWLKSTGLI